MYKSGNAFSAPNPPAVCACAQIAGEDLSLMVPAWNRDDQPRNVDGRSINQDV